MNAPDFMAVLYAAVSAVEEGKVAEMDVEYREDKPEGGEIVVVVTVRRESPVFGAPEVDA